MTPARPFHVLLVEDNASDVRLMQDAFGHARHPVRISVVVNGEDAWTRITESGPHEPIDLVLLDFRLPCKSGRELLVELKRHPRLRRIPVLVMSTSDDEDDVRLSYELHANGYLEKPGGYEQRAALVRAIEDFWITHVRLAKEA